VPNAQPKQLVARAVNDQMRVLAGEFGLDDVEVLCECRDTGCTKRVRTTTADYDALAPQGYLMAPDHASAAVEKIAAQRNGLAAAVPVSG
jgi:hypothetical protein